MSLSRQLIEEAIRLNSPFAFLADTGRGNLNGISSPVRVFPMEKGFEAVCDTIVKFIDQFHDVGMNFEEDYDPKQKLDQLATFYRFAVFFSGNGPWGTASDAMLCTTDRPTLSNETREWILKRLDPNPRDPIHWYRSLDGESKTISYDHVVFAKSRPQHIGMPALDEPIEIDVHPDDDDTPKGFRSRIGRRLGRG